MGGITPIRRQGTTFLPKSGSKLYFKILKGLVERPVCRVNKLNAFDTEGLEFNSQAGRIETGGHRRGLARNARALSCEDGLHQ